MCGDSRLIQYPPDIPHITHLPRRRSSTLSTTTKHAIAKSAKRAKSNSNMLDDSEDEGIWHERDTSAAFPLLQNIPLNPKKQRPRSKSTPIDFLSPPQGFTDKFPPTHAVPAPPMPPPSLTSRFSQAVSSVTSYISSFLRSSPAIIEYSDAEIKKQTKVRICVEDLSPEDVGMVRVQALVINAGLVDGEERANTIEVKAKPKRVREILGNAGCYTTEEVYETEIRRALRGLKQ